MAQSSYPFESQSTTETQYSRIFRELQDSGVVGSSNGTDLKVTASTTTALRVNVAAGNAFVRGHFYENTAQVSLDLAPGPAGGARWDSIILRLDPASDSIVLTVASGPVGGSQYVPVQTDTGIFEITLAYVYVPAGFGGIIPSGGNSVIDKRPFVGTRIGTWRMADRPTNPRVGQTGYNTDIKAHESWELDGTGAGRWVSRTKDTGWLDVPLTTTATSAGWSLPAGQGLQARQIGSQVFLRGFAANAGFKDANWTKIATLPAAISPAPAIDHQFPVGGNTSAGRAARIKANTRDLELSSSVAANIWFSLTGITYWADA